MISQINVVTAMGAKNFRVGGSTENGHEIVEIKATFIMISRDAIDHYCGYNSMGDMVFSINCLAPCEIEYDA